MENIKIKIEPLKNLFKIQYEIENEIEKNDFFLNVNGVKKEIEEKKEKEEEFYTSSEDEALISQGKKVMNDKNIDYYVYTDGACINNGKKNAKAGYGIYFGENDNRNMSKRIEEGKQTNNVAELMGIIEAYKIIENDINNEKKVCIVTDSSYSLRCITSYGKKCNEKCWKEDIPNKELVKYAYELFKNKENILFLHIKAHTGKKDKHSLGNEKADELANLSIGITGVKDNINKKIYLNVPYEKKEEAKILGAKWDASKKKWYILNENENKRKIIKLFS